MTEKVDLEKAELEAVGTLPQDDVANGDAHASAKADDDPRVSDSEVPPKKRKTRRGKSKRKNVHPYRKSATKSSSNNVRKPEAPYNSNRFLIEDHGDLDGIDEEFKKTDQASTSTVTRTRDSSLSVDSDAEFYSTPDDEEVFLIKDFDDQYESIQAERLQALTKDELIRDFLLLESKFEILSKRLRSKALDHKNLDTKHLYDVQREIQRLTLENENLKRENENLRTRLNSSSGSADSETDSSDTCSSTTSSLSRPESPVDFKHTNGHVDTVKSV